MKIEKKLFIIGVISFAITLVLFFLDSDPMYLGFSGAIKTIFEIGMMTFLVFLVIAINFFAISFVVRKVKEFF